MNPSTLSEADHKLLLQLARQFIQLAVNRQELPRFNLAEYSADLKAEGASFVTLTLDGELRGCIGALKAYQPLVQDVCEHAVAAAMEDYRFPPIIPAELTQLHIEISRLTQPEPLEYRSPDELPTLLRPGVDGVILQDGIRRATFLPQVWEQVASPQEFLSQLCWKMGGPIDLWQRKILKVRIYQVEEWQE